LRIGIDEQHAERLFLAHGCQQPDAVRLADPALQVEHRENVGTMRSSSHVPAIVAFLSDCGPGVKTRRPGPTQVWSSARIQSHYPAARFQKKQCSASGLG